jgi:soluble lytic murein transglycosylase-like protein
MRLTIGIAMLSSALAINVYAGNIVATRKADKVVYTNLNKPIMLSGIFSLGKRQNYSKQAIIQLIKKKAYKFDLDPNIAVAIAKIESSLNHASISKSGAVGIMQLKEKTAKYYGVKNINNLEQNIEGGVRFLKHLSKKYKDIRLVAAAYNAGETMVNKYKGIPPIPETQRYVQKFLKAYYNKDFTSNSSEHSLMHKKHIYKNCIKKMGNTYSNVDNSLW